MCVQFGESEKLRLVRILRSTVMVRVGGGWMALDEFLQKNDPCRCAPHPHILTLTLTHTFSLYSFARLFHVESKRVQAIPSKCVLYKCICRICVPMSRVNARAAKRSNIPELREHFVLPEWASQKMAAFRSKRVEPERAAGADRGAAAAAGTGVGEKLLQLQVPSPPDPQHRRSRSPAAERVHRVVGRLYSPARQLRVHQHAHGEPDEEHSETCPLAPSAQVLTTVH